MGVKLLETFMKKIVPNGYKSVDIIEECDNFQRNKGKKPILVIDLLGMLNWLITDGSVVLCGGDFVKYRNDLENFLKKLSKSADLVFFEDGPVMAEKSETWIDRQNKRYQRTIEIMDQVYAQLPLNEIVENNEISTITATIPTIEDCAKRYGKLIVTVTKECDAELALYASENPSVLAIIADDSDFLIFSGSWRYFSLRTLDKESFKTFEFDRAELRSHLNVTEYQLRVMATLGGNDVLKAELLQDFHKKKCGTSVGQKFKLIVDYLKKNLNLSGEELVEALSKKVFKNSGDRIKEMVKDSLNQYDLNFVVPDFSDDPLLSFCRKNYLKFSFATLQRFPKTFNPIYIDLRSKEFPDIYEVAMQMFRKQVGILLQHQRTKRNRFEVCTRKNHEENYQKYVHPPHYPLYEVPPLIEFLNREEFPEHDEDRFKLLKWLISERNLKDYDLKEIPAEYFVDVLILAFLTTNGFITTTEADFLLLTIKRVVTRNVPENLEPPSVLDKKAFQIALLFSKVDEMICRCLEVTGLWKITRILNFNGVLFHKMYSNMIAKDFAPKIGLADLESIRIYK